MCFYFANYCRRYCKNVLLYCCVVRDSFNLKFENKISSYEDQVYDILRLHTSTILIRKKSKSTMYIRTFDL